MINTDNIDKAAVFAAENSLSKAFETQGLDSAPGTAIRELVVRPTAVTRAQEEDWRRSLISSLDLNAIAAGTIPGEDDLLDAIASIYRITRREGGETSGTISLDLNWDGRDVYVNSSFSFRVNGASLQFDGIWIGNGSGSGTVRNGVHYAKIQRYPADVDDDGTVTYSSEMTIPVRCPSGGVYSAGTIVDVIGPGGVINGAVVLSPITGASGRETNQELAARILQALPPGVMSTPLQIQNTIGHEFGRAPSRVAVISGQNGAKRAIDAVTGLTLPGFVDVYTAAEGDCPTEVIDVTATAVTGGWQIVLEPPISSGAYTVTSLLADGEPVQVFNVSRSLAENSGHIISDATATFSTWQVLTITFEGAYDTPPECLVTVRKQSGIDTIQAFCDSSEKRCPSQDTVVRAASPVFLNISVAVTSGTAVGLDSMKEAVCSYVNSLPVGRGYISASDIETPLRNIGVNVVFPLSIRAQIIDEDGVSHYMISNDGYLGAYKYAKGSVFYLSASDIQVVAR